MRPPAKSIASLRDVLTQQMKLVEHEATSLRGRYVSRWKYVRTDRRKYDNANPAAICEHLDLEDRSVPRGLHGFATWRPAAPIPLGLRRRRVIGTGDREIRQIGRKLRLAIRDDGWLGLCSGRLGVFALSGRHRCLLVTRLASRYRDVTSRSVTCSQPQPGPDAPGAGSAAVERGSARSRHGDAPDQGRGRRRWRERPRGATGRGADPAL